MFSKHSNNVVRVPMIETLESREMLSASPITHAPAPHHPTPPHVGSVIIRFIIKR